MKRRLLSYILIISILITGIGPSYVGIAANDGNSEINKLIDGVKTSKENIIRGQKNVNWDVSRIEARINNEYEINKKYKDDAIERHIKLLINGEEDLYSNKEIEIDYKNNILSIKSNNNGEYLFNESTHYNIFIPKDYFVLKENGNSLSKDLYFNFVTQGDIVETKDIAYLNLPGRIGSYMIPEKGLIFIKFIDEINLTSGANNFMEKYLDIEYSVLEDAKNDEWKTISEDLKDFSIRVGGGSKKDTLIIEKEGTLSEIGEYVIKIKEGMVGLGDSLNKNLDISPIYNEDIEIKFNEPELIKNIEYSTDKDNIPNYMEIEFKMPIKFNDKTEIKLKSKDNIYINNLYKHINIVDGNILILDFREFKDELVENKIYNLILGKGALDLKERDSYYNNNIFNIYFITGSENPIYPGGPEDEDSNDGSTEDGSTDTRPISNLSTINYSSDLSFDNDILNKETTRLDGKGNIYITLESDIGLSNNKKIFWNKNIAKTKKEIIDSFRLYEINRTVGKNYPNNIIYINHKREVPIKDISIVDGKTLKIEPSNDLMLFNQYEIELNNREIVTDSYRGRLSKIDPLVLGQKFWTKKGKKSTEIIDWSDYGLEPGNDDTKIEQNSDGSFDLKVNLTPNYDPSGIEDDFSIDFILGGGGQILINPDVENPYDGIHIINEETGIKEDVEFFEINNMGGGGSKISIYPKDDLDTETEYKLIVDEGIFIDRSGSSMGELIIYITIVEANIGISPIIRVKTDKEEIIRGQKNVEWSIHDLEMEIDGSFRVNPKYKDGKIWEHIKIFANGEDETRYEVDSKGNKKYKDMTYKDNKVKISTEEISDYVSDMQPFVLREGTHYVIVVPKDYFVHKTSGEVINKDVHFNFMTKGDSEKTEDIIYLNLPGNVGSYINSDEGQIVLKFIEDISFNEEFIRRIKEFFEIEYKILINAERDEWKTIKEDIEDYSIDIKGNKIIFQRLDEDGNKTSLNVLGEYRIKIKEGIVYITKTKPTKDENIEKIYNDEIIIIFERGSGNEDIIKSIRWGRGKYPGDNNVPINPFIHIEFKKEISILDLGKIKISSDAGIYTLDITENIWVSEDNRTLYININDLDRSLRKNTAYKLIIGAGTLTVTDEKDRKTENEEIIIHFITGDEPTKERGRFRSLWYSSDDSTKNDLIDVTKTELKKDGNIYIKFANDLLEGIDREISWDKSLGLYDMTKDEANEKLIEFFKLYKLPKAYNQKYDKNGIIFDQEFLYNELEQSLPLNGKDELIIKSVEIIGDRTIKIEPKYDLLEFNQYEIKMTDKDILVDNYGEKLSSFDSLIKGQKIWTKEGTSNKNINWDMGSLKAKEVIEGIKVPSDSLSGLSFELHGVPNYGTNKPIVLYLNTDNIIPNPKVDKPLRKIKLLEGENKLNVTFNKFRIEYIEIDGVMKTKISIYPNKELNSGRKYKLEIPNDVFVDRSNNQVEGFESSFVIEGDGEEGVRREIEKIEWNWDGAHRVKDGIFSRLDFDVEKTDISFEIKGFNFAEDIKQLRFVRESDGKVVIVPKKYLNFESINSITGTITEEVKKELNKIFRSNSSVDENGLIKSSMGNYKIYIDFDRGEVAKTTRTYDFTIVDRPIVIGTTPGDRERYVQPKYLLKQFPGETEETLYIKIEFNSEISEIELGSMKTVQGMVLRTKTGTENILDETKELKIEGSTLYVPVKGGLEDNQEYVFTMSEEIYIRYKLFKEIFELTVYPYSFSFITNVLPVGNRLFEGTVPEDYDSDYPIVIDGDQFNNNIEVKFIKNNGDTFYADDVQIRNRDGGQRLYIYLPDSRRSRLDIGLYDIVLKNSNEYDEELKHGVLSVVKAGDHIPHDQYRIIEDSSLGLVMEMKEVSETKLDMNDRWSNDNLIRLDLDEIMGDNTWTRTIEYYPRTYDTIGTMELDSQWVNIKLRNLSLSSNYSDRLIKLRVGRATPFMESSVKGSLYGRSLKSDLIEISGENFRFSTAEIEIPYKESDGYNLQLLRFDEITGDFIQVPSEIDRIERVVKGISDSPGIFLIAE